MLGHELNRFKWFSILVFCKIVCIFSIILLIFRIEFETNNENSFEFLKTLGSRVLIGVIYIYIYI